MQHKHLSQLHHSQSSVTNYNVPTANTSNAIRMEILVLRMLLCLCGVV